MSLGNRIKIARERLKSPTGRGMMTQTELGALVGRVSKQSVYQWENDLGVPIADKLPALRKALHVTFVWLLTGEGLPPEPSDSAVLFENMVSDRFDNMRRLAKVPGETGKTGKTVKSKKRVKLRSLARNRTVRQRKPHVRITA
jgi:transcriptional regulator with XRE-family HTH domain